MVISKSLNLPQFVLEQINLSRISSGPERILLDDRRPPQREHLSSCRMFWELWESWLPRLRLHISTIRVNLDDVSFLNLSSNRCKGFSRALWPFWKRPNLRSGLKGLRIVLLKNPRSTRMSKGLILVPMTALYLDIDRFIYKSYLLLFNFPYININFSVMKQCHHSFWLSLGLRGNGTDLIVSTRVQNITEFIPNPNTQTPGLLVLVGNATKTLVLKEVFGVKRTRHFSVRRSPAEIHLHLDPSSIFQERPLFIADGDLSKRISGKLSLERCHEIVRREIKKTRYGTGLRRLASSIYSELLSPLTDVFCFFCDDLGGFKQVASQLATWLEHGNLTGLAIRPRVVLVTANIPVGVKSEKKARAEFLTMLRRETSNDLFDLVSAIDVIALFPSGSISVDARHRLLKERLLDSLDRSQKTRRDARMLFSATHFASLLESAYEHFASCRQTPFNFIKASRAFNPIAENLAEHLSNFLSQVSSLEMLTKFAAPSIASSFLLDNYPPDAHRKCSTKLLLI
jgi:hypothetical protein